MIEAIIMMFVLVIFVSTIAFTEIKLSLKYKRRWNEALAVIKNQEDRYRELLEGGNPSLPPPKGPWTLRSYTAPNSTGDRNGEPYKGDGIFFVAIHQNGNKVRLVSKWAADSSPEWVSRTHGKCLKTVQKMNEAEVANVMDDAS